jgi:hypothetical protein
VLEPANEALPLALLEPHEFGASGLLYGDDGG